MSPLAAHTHRIGSDATDLGNSLLRGAIAGSSAKTIVYPFDRVKMIYQVRFTSTGVFRVHLIFQNLLHIINKEGFIALWKGNLTAIGRTFPYSGISFSTFDLYKRVFEASMGDGTPKWFSRILAGGFAGVTATTITYPLDVWNTRMAVARGKYRYSEVILLRQDGMGSLYRGIMPTLLGIFPYAAISFFTFETLKQGIFSKRNPKSDGSPHRLYAWQSMLCGGTAGALSQTITYPLDTTRKFMQANAFLYNYGEECHFGSQHARIMSTLRHIYNASGIRGFYNGVSLTWIKGFGAAGLSFTLNEALRNCI